MNINWAPLTGWLLQHGLRILLIFLIFAALYFISRKTIPALVRTSMLPHRKMPKRTQEEMKKRADTLSNVLVKTAETVLIIAAVFMILSELGLDIAPVLAGIGIVGIAVGFGAQSLVKDLIAGVFILMENQYRVGDVVRIADIAGLVEEVGLRRTILRDLDGIVHVVPNGQIRVASNFTKEWSRVNLNISVGYGEDLDRVMAVINRIGEEMAEDAHWGPLILKAPHVLRVDAFEDSGIAIKILGDTKPLKQWDIMGELRRRIKRVFDEEGIEIPWPHTKVFFGSTPPKEDPAEGKPVPPAEGKPVPPVEEAGPLPPSEEEEG
jgi:small conductance mechanosensitive channel